VCLCVCVCVCVCVSVALGSSHPELLPLAVASGGLGRG